METESVGSELLGAQPPRTSESELQLTGILLELNMSFDISPMRTFADGNDH